MNFKRILILVMTFAMLLSTFAPTLSVFAEELHNHSHETNEETLNYVSLGDSMTNGIGMDGYDATSNNGYLEVAPNAYPSKFASMLAGYTGPVANGQTRYEGANGTVNLTQLATSAARAEDIWYIINHGTENAFEPDHWTYNDLLTNPWRWGDPSGDHASENDRVAEVYREAIKNADVISYAGGNGNFGVFFMNRVMRIVGFDSGIEEDRLHYGYMTVENAVELCGANEELKSLVMQVYNKGYDYLASNGMPADMICEILNYLAYVTASYLVTYNNIMDYIVGVNPDVTVIVLPLINNGLDFNFDITVNGITRHFNAGTFLSAIYKPVSAYMAGYAALKQEVGAYKNAKFYYAELPVDENGATIQVETFAQAFDELYAPVIAGEGYPSSRMFCHNRFIPEIRSFVFPILFGTEGEAFDEYDVQAYEIAQSNGIVALAAYAMANPAKVQWIAQYLGIVDTILGAIAGVPEIDGSVFAGADFSNFNIFDLIGSSMNGIDEKINNNIANNIDPASVEAVYLFIVENVVKPQIEEQLGTALDMQTVLQLLETEPSLASAKEEAMANAITLASLEVIPSAMSTEISKAGFVHALLALYGRLKLAWGLSAHPSAAGHTTLAQSLIMAYENEYTAKDETLANIDRVVELVEKFYEKGYAYVDAHGYTNKVVSVIDRAINRINRVDLSDNRMTAAFRVKLQAELDAMVETLEELKAAVVNDDAKTVDGLKATILALKDDVKTHLKNVYGLCKQFGIDFINLDEVQAVIDAVETMVDVIVEVTTEYVIPAAKFLCGAAKVIVPIVVKVVLFVEEYGDDIAEIIFTVIDVYHYTYDVLVNVFGSIENAINVAIKVCEYIVDVALKVPGFVENAYNFGCDIYNLVVAVYGETQNVIKTAEAVYEYVLKALDDLDASIKDRIEATTNGNYELKDDSAYVAIGNSEYGPELAKLLNLGNKFSQFGVQDDYLDAIAKADLITIKVNNGEFYAFAYTQLMGTVANVIRSNNDLMGWCDNKLVGDDIRAMIGSYGINLDAETIELEWNNYLTDGQMVLLDAFLAKVKEEVLDMGVAEKVELDLTPMVVDILDANGLMLPGVSVSIEPLVIPTADLLVYAVENLLYSYVQFIERTSNLLSDIREVAPNATVVMTHVANPLANLPYDISSFIPEFETYTGIVDEAVNALNAYLYTLAFLSDNTIFVDSEDAQVIYDALNVCCDHVYDDCLDGDCNRCAKVREIPGHSFTKYVYNNDATCTTRGTETAKCDGCDAVDTRQTGKALGHSWKDADCVNAQTCTRCGQVGKAALGHKYDNKCDKDCNVCGAKRSTTHKFGEWKILEEATYIKDGLRERVCMYCGHVEQEHFSAIKEDVNIVAVIALAVGSLIVAFGGATAVILLIQKKKEQ